MEESPAHESWKDWFQLHGPKLLLCARLWTRSLADAEDVVQDGFVRFWRHQRGLGGDPRPLLFTSIHRAAVDLGRRDGRRVRREQQAGEAQEPDGNLFDAGPGGAERTEAVEQALRRLPGEQRDVLTLKIWGELTFDEIARQLGVPPNTAASRYRYALATLRRELTAADCHG
jgi:RNA polymerase sigma-70 factor (ECF subfamily)